MGKRSAFGSTIAFAVGAFPIAACALVADIEPIAYQPAKGDSGDVPPMDAATSDQDASADAASSTQPCDEDGDGFTSEACGGTDCDDTDSRVRPDADFVDERPPAGKIGDWNCDGKVTKQFSEGLLCNSFSPEKCPLEMGFLYATDCGEQADFVTCYLVGDTCATNIENERRQGCK